MKGPTLVSWNRDYEPYAKKRDGEMAELFARLDIEAVTERDHLILEPTEVLKSEKPGDFYQVYTPYSRKWFAAFSTENIQARVKAPKTLSGKHFNMSWNTLLKKESFPFQDAYEKFEKKNNHGLMISIPDAGHEAALKALKEFKPRVNNYKIDRDIPSVKGTSHFSIFFKNGSLTPAQAIAYLGLKNITGKEKDSATQFVKEIVWREFYYSILFHRPDVEKESFLKQYLDLPWENSKKFFEHWQNGTTGFPIVDAGMRQLLTTGWMHNRVRMIVASFLTKDLLIDWKWGENHFMKYLLDGDLAPNNGGWQWAASTGCDPQPYFRIFNPWLQSKRFDPTGEYIKKYIPELKDAPAKTLHLDIADRTVYGYPKPIVDHSVQRQKAIAIYKKTRSAHAKKVKP
jgi:deoxyribodipyrimidine photo-lyase